MRVSQVHQFRRLAVAGFILIAVLVSWNCKPTNPGEQYKNTLPVARLANIPPDSIRSNNPRLTLTWLGDDPDGFVVAYKYRWSFRFSSTDTFQYKPWVVLLNIQVVGRKDPANNDRRALIMDGTEADAPKVYKYFATLPPEGLTTDLADAIDSGRAITVEGIRVWASNPVVLRYPQHESPNSGTFIFDSQDTLNPHTFEVAAIDNNGYLGNSASVTFFTPQVPPPNVEIVGFHNPKDTLLVLGYTTDTFDGISFTLQGFDPNSRTLDYSWVVDRDQWPPNSIPWSDWSSSTIVRVTSRDFPDSLAVSHRLYVRARNEFGSISTDRPIHRVVAGRDTLIYPYSDFSTVYPAFKQGGYQKRVLIIINSYEWVDSNKSIPAKPDFAYLQQYYRDLYDSAGLAGKYDFWIAKRLKDGVYQGVYPTLGFFGNYSTVHIVADITSAYPNFKWSGGTIGGGEGLINIGKQSLLIAFADVGGNVIFTAWNTRTDNIQTNGAFYNQILHWEVQENGYPNTGAFVSAQGVAGYPDVVLDPAKIDTAAFQTFPGSLPQTWTYRPFGFGEIIFRYHGVPTDTTRGNKINPVIEGKPVGIRYQGITYNTVFIGFPLYYIQKPQAIQVMRQALRDVKEIN